MNKAQAASADQTPIVSRGGKALFVFASLLAMVLLRVALEPYLKDEVPYMLFLASVAGSARWAGWRWGLAATALGVLLGSFFFARPRFTPQVADPRDWVAAGMFVFAALIITLSFAAEGAARRRLSARDRQLSAEQAQRHQLELQLEEARRLEAVGKLAGGVAHDFNNLLTVVVGSASLLRETLPEESLLESIEVAAQRGTALTRQLLGFARRQVLRVEPITLNEVVEEAMLLLRRLVPEDVALVSELQNQPWLVQGDRTQVQQVVLNLVTNARDALPQGGTIQIRTGNVTLDERFAARHPEVSPGEYAHLSVSDNGVGMTDELRRRVFEPFFTTKEVGRGTGLGLAVTYGIVKQMKGHISVSSRSPGGTVFDVYWPRTAAVAPRRLQPVSQIPDAAPSLVVLLVDDDELVRRVTQQMLQLLGHTVLSAENGAVALQIAKAYGSHIDVLLTDVVMPWMNGKQLSEQLLRQRPDLAVLFMSGYTENVILSRGVLHPDVALLVKPFTPEALASALNEATSVAHGRARLA